MPKVNPITTAYNQGKKEATIAVRNQVLNYLYLKYLDPSVKRESPIAREILEITRELSEMMRV